MADGLAPATTVVADCASNPATATEGYDMREAEQAAQQRAQDEAIGVAVTVLVDNVAEVEGPEGWRAGVSCTVHATRDECRGELVRRLLAMTGLSVVPTVVVVALSAAAQASAPDAAVRRN